MNKIKCLVLDDEPIAREIIESFIERTPYLEISGSFGKPLDALNFIQNNKVDIILTDIEMPQISGIQLINSLSYRPAIIFITAYREYALDGFDQGVVDYLVKPVSYDRFLKAINRAQQSINNHSDKKTIPFEEKADRIFIKADNKLVKILFEDIIYIEALKDYLRIHISETERYITHSTMKAIEEKLPDYFFRIQRSFIINTKFAKSFYGNTVQMTIGENLPISLSAKADLFKKLGIENI
jgi:DNA-binding LytR/AlgR family response regulator